MDITDVLDLLGGVALFLFGMALMGDGLKKVAGNKLELILYRLSSTPLKAILLGTGVTGVIQSSSAVSVMVVGFVNSSMMKLEQAVAVIMGAIIGTSVTGWLIALSSISGDSGVLKLLNTETLTAVVAVIGIILRMASKKKEWKHIGDIMLGFAVLMFGMKTMSNSVSGLKEDPAFIEMMTSFSNPFLGILVGALLTAVLQSASASVGILQALSSTGTITFSIAFPIMLGITFGASVPVLMSAIGSTTGGKRTALSYSVLTLSGSVIVGSLFYLVNAIWPLPIMEQVQNALSIAVYNSLLRLAMILCLAPFIKQIVKAVTLMIREDALSKAQNRDFERLEERFLNYPQLAVEQSRLVINSMASTTGQNLFEAMKILPEFDQKGYDTVVRLESLVDKYEDKVGAYLMKITEHDLNEEQNAAVGEYLHCITDLERISDHALNIAERALEKKEKNIFFTDDAWKELNVLFDAVKEITSITLKALTDNRMELAYRVEPLEEVIDQLCDVMKLNHIERLKKGSCDVQRGYVFNDLLTDFERVSDHCSNIAIAIIELRSEKMESHEYADHIKERNSNHFRDYYMEYSEKYKV